MNLYDENGYIDFPSIWKCGCPFMWLFGGRGTGKTFGALKFLIDDNKIKMIYMRRTARQIELSCTPRTMPFKAINAACGRFIEPKKEGDFVYFRENDKDIAFGAALSTFYNLRGVSLEDYDVLFFDEVIPEPMERTRRGEGKALLDAIETINRNRELQGRKPLRCIFCGNSDTLDSDILRAFGIIFIIEKMVAGGKEVYINRESGHAVFNFYRSPISLKKSDTALYKATKNKAFRDKALLNQFADLRDARDIKRIPLKECRIVYNIDNELGIYEHKSGIFYYICGVINNGGRTFHMIEQPDRRSLYHIYTDVLRPAIDAGNVLFDSFQSKSAFENFIFNQ